MSENDTRKEIFQERLNKIMSNRGLKVTDLICLIDDTGELPEVIAENTARGWCKGKNVPSLEKLAALAIALDVSVDYLLGIDNREIYGDIINAVNAVLKQHGRALHIDLLSGAGHMHRMQCITESNMLDLYGNASTAYGRRASYPHTTEDTYIIVDGNIYPEDYYCKHEGEILNSSESIYNIVDMAVRQRSIQRIKALRAAYNKNRVGLGIIGSALNADKFILLCYILGYFSKHQ